MALLLSLLPRFSILPSVLASAALIACASDPLSCAESGLTASEPLSCANAPDPFPLACGCRPLGVVPLGVSDVAGADAGVVDDDGPFVFGGAGVVDVDVGCLAVESGDRFGSSDGVDMQDPMMGKWVVDQKRCREFLKDR